MSRTMSLVFLLICLASQIRVIVRVEAQQSYVDNEQLDCYNHYNSTDGNICNGIATSCNSYLTFRCAPPYNTPSAVGFLMNSDTSAIAEANNVSDVATFPTNQQILIPINCSCSSVGGRSYYQHNASYTLKYPSETYFNLANNTYQGLTTCQALMAQNPYGDRNLKVNMNLQVPLRCACPTATQSAAGVKYLLSYLVAWGDSIPSIAQRFRVTAQTVLDANKLSPNKIIFPFTPILVPLTVEPSSLELELQQAPPPAPAPPPQSPTPRESKSNSSKKWILVGVGTGAALLLLLALFAAIALIRKAKTVSLPPIPTSTSPPKPNKKSAADGGDYMETTPESWSTISSQGIRYAIESVSVYKLEEVQRATENFNESNKIGRGGSSVYRGLFKGDAAAVKIMKGDVSSEINILKRINHSNIIRLSGFCVHGGNTYLVYEYADNGCVADWLHHQPPNNNDNNKLTLSWKHRVQIAHDVADALNYLHNFTKPPYIHKNLKTTNILLDGSFRAKISNFGLARTLEDEEEEQGALQLTRHVVGTQGYMAPEYIENGVITTKLDVFAFGVVTLELLSGREAINSGKNAVDGGGEELLSASISEVLQGDNVREKLQGFIDPSLKHEYPLDLAFSMAQLAKCCVDRDLNSRPAIAEAFMTLSKILSSSLDWDPSDELKGSRSLSHGR
ncbi:hypothetical protein FNV43_RR20552 [Rhamnella rubrinervis]|uniref:Uncharacterized protein n=1 Tax=Rhamnella rubrinervis TaxID=2594499 RepID=A0A8K0DW53_9ROSA|nr:hypothetical protein FNV43_RR20552 [Rhamnella rubrinervis]